VGGVGVGGWGGWGGEQLQVKRLQNILAPNGPCLMLLKKDKWFLNNLHEKSFGQTPFV
jgi:hypothetical protein